MAASMDEVMSKLRHLAECAICLQQSKVPRTLPCQHSFCTACLQRVLGTAQKIACPSCQEITPIPNGVLDLPVDFKSNSCLEILSQYERAKAPKQVGATAAKTGQGAEASSDASKEMSLRQPRPTSNMGRRQRTLLSREDNSSKPEPLHHPPQELLDEELPEGMDLLLLLPLLELLSSGPSQGAAAGATSVKPYKKRTDFRNDDDYAKYICDNIQIGKLICCRKSYEDVKEGDIGQVQKLNGGGLHDPRIQVYWQHKKGTSQVRYTDVDLLGIPSPKATTPPLALGLDGAAILQVGKKVRVKPEVARPKYAWGFVTYESIGTLTALVLEDWKVKVDFPGQGDWTGHLSEIEHPPSAQAETMQDPAPTEPKPYKKRAEFENDDDYAVYIRDNIQLRKLVRCRKTYEGIREGDIGKVKKLDHEGLHDLNIEAHWQEKDDSFWVPYNYVELLGLKPPDSSIPQVGQKVRVKPGVKSPTYEWGSVTRDSIGTVTAVIMKEGDIKVDFPEQADWTGCLDEMEVVPTTQPGTKDSASKVTATGTAESKPFKKRADFGDDNAYAIYIRNNIQIGSLVRSSHTYERLKEGDIGQVIKLDRDGLHDQNIQAYWHHKDGPHWVRYTQVELLGFPSPEALVPKSSVTIKVGQKVRVKPGVVKPMFNWGLVTHKSVGTVTVVSMKEELVKVDFPQQPGWTAHLSEIEPVPNADAEPEPGLLLLHLMKLVAIA